MKLVSGVNTKNARTFITTAPDCHSILLELTSNVASSITLEWNSVQRKGFPSPQEYIEKRNQLLREIESLRPVDYDDLIEAADLLENFPSYWEACMTIDNPDEARKQLLAKIVDRVFIYDDMVIAIALHGDYAVVLDNAGMAPV